MKNLFFLFLTVTLWATPAFSEEPTVRVAILQEVSSARVTVAAACRLVDLGTGKVVREFKRVEWQQVEPGNPGLTIGGDAISSSAVLLEPETDVMVRVNARPYRGSLIFYRASSGKLTVVNRIDLERYLVSALPSETDQWWPMEALKAHAVVSRTLVAHRIWVNRDKPFDVTADTRVHLYGGVPTERKRARQAVEATRGQVLAYEVLPNEMELLSATFHANCGGHTEDYSELWQGQGDLAPLRGRPDPYCRNLRHYRWKTHMPLATFGQALGPVTQETGRVLDCQVVERNRSGRARTIRIVGEKGSVTISGRTFRESLGANQLKSLHFTVTVQKDGITFGGYGWGHGVGLCQWGCYGMASKKHTMDEILDFYFPGAHRRSLSGLPGFADQSRAR